MPRALVLRLAASLAFGAPLAFVALSPCGCARGSSTAGAPGQTAATRDARPVGRYGAAVPEGAAAPIASVLADPAAASGKPLLVEGTVRAACTRKGCWMELADSMDKAAPGCRVTFKDYGFFVPTDSQGAAARVAGTLAVRTIAADDVAHYESEGGSFPGKLPDGSAREVRLVATGVELRR